jgi:hypothetical protein
MPSSSTPKQEPHLRCAQHGLVLVADRACALCRKERALRGRGGSHWAAVLGVTVAVGAMLVATHALNEPAPNEVGASSNSTLLPTRSVTDAIEPSAPVPGATRRTTKPSPALPRESEPSRPPPTAEDMHLGLAHVPAPIDTRTPPAPPRASIDREPRVADDPADFELPKR